MTEDAIAKQLARLCDGVDAIRTDIAAIKTDIAVEARSGIERERRIAQLESDMRRGFWMALAGLVTWAGTMAWWLLTGGKP